MPIFKSQSTMIISKVLILKTKRLTPKDSMLVNFKIM